MTNFKENLNQVWQSSNNLIDNLSAYPVNRPVTVSKKATSLKDLVLLKRNLLESPNPFSDVRKDLKQNVESLIADAKKWMSESVDSFSLHPEYIDTHQKFVEEAFEYQKNYEE